MVGERQGEVSGKRVFRASAPVRLDFAGGWTDVAPFAVRERGVVVNAAIELRAHVEVRPGGEGYRLHSDDMKERVTLQGPGALAPNGHLDLLKAALRRSAIGPCSLRTRCDAPSGSGLGSSGALDVALVAALDATRNTHRSPEELAEEAFQLESVEAALPGGRQDQYAAALGGFNRLTLEHGKVTVQRLQLEPDFAVELARHTVICYTGVSRVSSRTIERVVSAYERGDAEVTGALRTLAELAAEMAGALLAGNLEETGRLLERNWSQQQRLDSGMRTEEMARLEAAMKASGAIGGKAAGAGAGGSMFFVVRDFARGVAAARAAGAQVLPCAWAASGTIVEAGE